MDVNEEEIFVKVQDFPFYEISNQGRVRSWKHRKGRREIPIIMKTNPKERYLGVSLREGETVKRLSIHTLVLVHFKGTPKPGQVGRHLNNNPHDNRNGNLEWGSQKQNMRDKISHGTSQTGERNGLAKLDWNKVQVIRSSSPSIVNKYHFAHLYNVTPNTIRMIQINKTWKKEKQCK